MKKPKLVSLETLHRENISRFDTLAFEVRAHIVADNRRFDDLDKTLEGIATDMKSLLATRSFTRGVMRTVVLGSTAISTVIGLVIAYFAGHH